MALRVDFKNTKYAVAREKNKALDSWYERVSMALYFVGLRELTWDNLSTFLIRYNCLMAACGMRSPFDTDPTVVETFVGITTNVTPETDAQFFRRVAKSAKMTADDLRKQWETESREEKFNERWQREFETGWTTGGPA